MFKKHGIPLEDAHDSQKNLSSRWSDANWCRYNIYRYYTISFRYGTLRGMHTVREGRCFPFGQARTGAGIISIDIIPYRSDMVLSEGCTQFAKEDAFPSVKRELVQV